MSNFIVGDVARISVAISDFNGDLGDPSSLAVIVRTPTNSIVDLTADVVKDSIGNYHVDVSLDFAGSYGYRWRSLGSNQGAVEGSFFVNPWMLN